jgi:hypothetical protein
MKCEFHIEINYYGKEPFKIGSLNSFSNISIGFFKFIGSSSFYEKLSEPAFVPFWDNY